MTISPRFLDELRSRINVSDIVGKRVRLTRAGREFKACCPFHNEKSPSFYVNDDKQFFHCFGCGAHGSIIDFVMRYDNMSFPEAVESLAQQAGMQVPKSAPEDMEKAKREKDLYSLMDETTKWMEAQLRVPQNKVAYDYIRERGLNDEIISSFRIGYAPPDMQAMRKHLAGLGYNDSQMIEGGLLKLSEKSKEPYAFFRERVMFPVMDKRGRVVAFGGRVMPEHLRSPDRGDFKPPKYINSPDTPIFHKGKMLYGAAHARQAANEEGQPLVVVEGYLDVMACFRAGFRGAVAPLGTALTEDQILVLWKMIPQDAKIPVLCFDGDDAGRRAASRACERILPLLKPDHSAKIAFLPDGEDPDSLVKAKGRDALEAVLAGAMNLVDFLWLDNTQGKSFDTPEARAGLTKILMEDVTGRIADRTVQHYYREAFREKLRGAFTPVPFQKAQGAAMRVPWQPRAGYGKTQMTPPVVPLRRPSFARKGLVEMAMLASIINNPGVFHEVEEEFGHLRFPENRLDLLRQAVLSTLGRRQELDADGLRTHLMEQGFEVELGYLLAEAIYTHASFSRRSADEGAVLAGWREGWKTIQSHAEGVDMEQAKIAFKDDINKENESRWENLQKRPKTSDN